MAAELQRELRSLPGVASVEIEGDAAAPANVRVRLHPEADPERIGADVQRVLAAHGMRSRLSGDRHRPADVVSLPAPDAPVPPEPAVPPPVPAPGLPASPPPDAAGTPAPLASLTVEEGPDSVTVVATGIDGRRFSQRTTPSEGAVAAAVVAVVGALAEGRPPRLLGLFANEAGDVRAVTVVLERIDGTRVAGAAVVRAGRSYAVARAAWAALTG